MNGYKLVLINVYKNFLIDLLESHIVQHIVLTPRLSMTVPLLPDVLPPPKVHFVLSVCSLELGQIRSAQPRKGG